jgi:elongation of very long chain fatty acids protein 4
MAFPIVELPPAALKVINQVDTALVGWASNGVLADRGKRATYDWPLAHLDQALLVCLVYISLVFVLTTVTRALYGSKEAETPKGLSVAQKFAREPILVLQALYNPVQVVLCIYMIYAAIQEHQKRGMAFICNDFDTTNTGVAGVLWVFYLSKVLDFLDTVFIVTRRKWRQLSFLHLYHHTSIFMVYWLNLNAGYDGDIYYTVVLNAFIHMLMYFYYAVRTFNIEVPIFFKFLVTQSQRIQFVCMNAQACYLLYTGCAYPRNLTWMYLVYIISLLVLFTQFSNKTYKKGTKKSDKKQK